MKRLVIVPDGWPCRFSECRPGFFMFKDSLCLKTEYGGNEAYCVTGESFWGGAANENDRATLAVQPVDPVWEDFEA